VFTFFWDFFNGFLTGLVSDRDFFFVGNTKFVS
jgi:hypothetical protein